MTNETTSPSWTTMDPEIKELWARALESGEFKQGRGMLRVTHLTGFITPPDVSYCCLGVLTELYCRATGTTWEAATWHQRTILPIEVTRWAGLVKTGASSLTEYNSDPLVRYEENGHSFETYLTHLNDDLKFPFPEIATCVRESL